MPYLPRASEELKQLVIGRIEFGEFIPDIAKDIDRPERTLRDWWAAYKAGTIKKVEVVDTTPPLELDIPPEERWHDIEKRNAHRKEKINRGLNQSIAIPTNKLVAITFMSDIHLGDQCDITRLTDDTRFVASQPNFLLVDIGDAVDNFVKPKHAHVNLNVEVGIHEQWKMFEYWINDLCGGSLIASIGGNHDLWSEVVAGFDIKKQLLRGTNIKYNPDSMLLDMRIGKVDYRLGLFHTFRFNSQFNQTHAPKQLARMEVSGCDAIIMGDKHEYAQAEERIREDWIQFMRPGSYKFLEPYARSLSYINPRPVAPTLIFFPDRKMIVQARDPRLAAIFMAGYDAIGEDVLKGKVF